jgi:hypothetical protein
MYQQRRTGQYRVPQADARTIGLCLRQATAANGAGQGRDFRVGLQDTWMMLHTTSSPEPPKTQVRVSAHSLHVQ